MMTKNKMLLLAMILFALTPIVFPGCGGGGGGDSSTPASPPASVTPAPALKVLPADFDFGIVTNGNAVDTLEVTVENSGTADLSVSDIALSGTDKDNYLLNLNGGTSPCGSAASTIAVASNCTVTVDYAPQDFRTHNDADLTILSNDPVSPTYNMSLMGSKEDISEVNVKINQIEACPRANAKVYVSVTDQGGFPITTLDKDDFTLTEDGNVKTTATAVPVNDTATLSVALLMDYSRSITIEPDNVADMQNAAIDFVNQLGANDEAEIIKYATTIEVTQPFTPDKALLTQAIQSTPNVGTHTALFDAVSQAVTDISASTKARRAIIIITDGKDDDGEGGSQSASDLAQVIAAANANGVPVFTVGLGDADATILQQLADDTGGTYSDSTTSDNLATIYQQLADLLFTDQYILTYTSGLASTATGDLSVTATYAGLPPGTDTKEIPACSP